MADTEQELNEAVTCKEYLQVQTEGKRSVQRRLKHYNLDMILAVGYRVRLNAPAKLRKGKKPKDRSATE